MTILGAVTVSAATIVKVVAAIGIGIGGFLLGLNAFGLILPCDATCVPGMLGYDPPPEEMLKNSLIFIGGLAGWKFADWAQGKAHVMENKSRQEAELRRLQSAHGVAL